MPNVILAWPLKRSAIARLKAVAAGTDIPPAGAEVLRDGIDSEPVQVEYVIPAEPERLCVYGAPLRLQRAATTAEQASMYRETVTLEIRLRVYQPGEDVEYVDLLTGRLVQAVACALVAPDRPLVASGSILLSSVTQDPIALSPNPEPWVISGVSMIFTADLATT